MVTWPGTIPQNPLLPAYKETGMPNVVRTEVDVGTPKIRRRYTKELRPLGWSFIMTTAQLDDFDTFFWTTLGGGALPFDHTDPRTALTTSYQFSGEPTYIPLSGTRWRVNTQVLKLP